MPSTNFLRRMNRVDTAPYRDDGDAAIDSRYQTGLYGEEKSHTQLVRHHGGFFEVSGAGTLSLSMKNKDDTWTQALASVTLVTLPGKSEFRQVDRIGEGVSYHLSTNAVDTYFVLSDLTHFSSPYTQQR
jgi:hypothetical protein